jgi:uncharacterized protein YuzE
MEKKLIIFDKKGNTLDIWLDDPEKEFICEETGGEIIFKKDKNGSIIGIEILNVFPSGKKLPKNPVKLISK